MRHTSTHTYVTLALSEAAYHEIKDKLEAAGYGHCFHDNPEAPAFPVIDMHGLAVTHEIDMTPETPDKDLY